MRNERLLRKNCVRFKSPVISSRKFFTLISFTLLALDTLLLLQSPHHIYSSSKDVSENLLVNNNSMYSTIRRSRNITRTPTLILTENNNGDKMFIPMLFVIWT